MKKIIRSVLFLTGGFFLFILDRFLKHLAQQNIDQENLWFGLVGWRPHLNTAGVFSLPANNLWLGLGGIIVLFFIIFFYWRASKKQPTPTAGIFLLILGASSNIFDRLTYGGVIDYLFIIWGTINISDLLIIGGVLYIWLIFKKKGEYVSQT